MLGLLDVVKAVGRGPSSWAGDGLLEALRQVRAIPMVGLASGDASGIALQLPYRQTEALIQLGTREAHPALGHGLLVRTSLPGDAGPGPDWALMRNRQEMTSLTRAHLVGSWVGSASFATFVAFYPNLLAPAGMTPVNIALSEMHRVRWLAEIGRSGSQG